MTAQIFAGTLWNGEILVRNIPCVAGSASVVLGETGTINATLKLPLRDPVTGIVVPITDLIEPELSFLAYVDGDFMAAGPIHTEQWFADTKTLTYSAGGIGDYLKSRFIIPPLDDADEFDTPAGKMSTFGTEASGLSYRTIAKKVVQQALSWDAGSFPLVYADADIAGTNYRNYPGEEGHQVWESLRQLAGVINGPDIQFRPRYQTDHGFIEWVLYTGDTELTQTTYAPSAPDHKWDLTVPVPAIRGTQITRAGSKIATDVYEVGSQVEDIPEIAKGVDTTLPARGYMRFEKFINLSSVETLEVLQEHADDDVFAGRFHEETWNFQANKNITPRLGEYNEGDYCVVVVPADDPRIKDRQPRLRILSITTSLDSDFVAIQCAPERV